MANSYFTAVLSTEQFALLKQNRIEFIAMDMDGRMGIIINGRDMVDAAKVLGLTIAERKMTPYREIEEIIFASGEPGAKEKEEEEMPGTRQFSVDIKSWNGGEGLKRSFIAAAREILLPVVKKDIEIFVPHSRVEKPKKNGKFNVFIWSAAEDIRGPEIPDKLWDIPVECRDTGFGPSNAPGAKVICDGDYAVAEIIGGNLYIFHDACHYHSDNTKKIFARILEEAAHLLGRPKNGKELKAEKQKRLEEARRKYIEACFGRHNGQFENAKRDLERARAEVNRYGQDLVHTLNGAEVSRLFLECLQAHYKDGEEILLSAVDKIFEAVGRIVKAAGKEQKDWRVQYAQIKTQELNEAKDSLASYKRSVKTQENNLAHALEYYSRADAQLKILSAMKAGGDGNKYGLEFDKLLAMEKVLDVEVGGKTLKVFTDTLFCEHPETHRFHEIGKFEIRIPIDGSVDIRMYNLTRKIRWRDSYGDWSETMHAPHIYADGRPCLGNMSAAFPELVARCEFSVAAMLAIQFIESANEDDGNAMEVIEKWPEAKAGAKKKSRRAKREEERAA